MHPQRQPQYYGPRLDQPSTSYTPHLTSAASPTESQWARSVTGISRQLLDSFAFNQVDHIVGDVAHMREYLVGKLPDAVQRPLDSSNDPRWRTEDQKVLGEYKGVIYSQQCLQSQQIILEYMLGKCLEQCRVCLDELRKTQQASRSVDESAAYVLRYGKSRGVDVDAAAVKDETAAMFMKVRRDLYELAEELKDLDESRTIAARFLRNPSSVLPLS